MSSEGRDYPTHSNERVPGTGHHDRYSQGSHRAGRGDYTSQYRRERDYRERDYGNRKRPHHDGGSFGKVRKFEDGEGSVAAEPLRPDRKRRHDDDASSGKVRAVEDDKGNVVAEHYNKLPELGRRHRTLSKIYYMRNFNNWVKSVLMKTFQDRLRHEGQQTGVVALDLGCGKGGDLLKWGKGNVKKVVCTDIAETSVNQCRDRYQTNSRKRKGRIFDAEFIVADSTTERLSDLYKEPGQKFDLVSSQFVVHYSFKTEDGAVMMVQNLCERLRKGGYFIGTTVNSQELRKRLDQSSNNSFGNSLYSCTFESKDEFKDFGQEYNFHLEGVVDCPEYVLKKEILEKLAMKYGMKLVMWQTFSDFFTSNSRSRENRELLKTIKALEYYPSKHLSADGEREYSHAKEVLSDSQQRKPGCNFKVGTLSRSEWDAAGLYVVFAFKKVESDDETFDVPHSDADGIPLLVIRQ